MPLFSFHPAEWAMFVFIFASLAIYTGAIGSYSGHGPTWALAQVVEWPFNNIIGPVFNSPFALLTLPLFILFVVWLVRIFGQNVDPGILGAVFVGVIAVTVGA